MLDTSISIKTDQFDGPLGLLLMLIQREDMDIKSLDLTKITQQYLEYLEKMKELNFDVAGEYLYLASTLVHLKSKVCLSEEELGRIKEGMVADTDIEIVSQADLIRRLEELEHFQKMGHKIWELPRRGEHIFTRPRVNRKEIVNSILSPVELEKLTLAMIDLIQRNRKKYQVIRRDRLSIKEKLVFLKDHLALGKKTTLDELIEIHGDKSIDNIVITFISLLELARLGRLDIYQNEENKYIYAEVIRSLEDFDVNQASGFDEESSTGPDPIADEEEAVNLAEDQELLDPGTDLIH